MADGTQAGPKLYFIRHAETAWSLSGQHTGRTDLALTESGEAQAVALAPWLHAVRFAHVLTSPLQRARRTCLLAGLGSTATVEPDLAEWNYGDYEGKLSSEIRMQRPGWDAFRDGCPGGETAGQVSDRADHLIHGLSRLDGNIALFSHGGFGSVLAMRWIGLPVAAGSHLSLDTASLSILAHNAGHPDVRAIALWNAVPAMLRDAAEKKKVFSYERTL